MKEILNRVKENKQMKRAKRDISLSNVIDGRILTVEGWEDMEERLREDLAILFRDFMLSKTRAGYKPRRVIQTKDFRYLEYFGIYRRLVYDTNIGKIAYYAGQSYPEEIATLKKLMMK